MTSPPASKSLNQAQLSSSINDAQNANLTQLRETGDAVPNPHFGDTLIAKRKLPEVRPWAHFVAGAYVPVRTMAF